VERALDIEARVGAEHHAGGVEEVEVGARDRRGDRAVDVGARAAGHPADDVANVVGTRERRALAGVEREALEAVEQVAPGPSAEVGADLEITAAVDARADRAVRHDPGRDRAGDRRYQDAPEPA